MMFCVVRDPMPTRIAILVAFAFLYAVCHFIRWYLNRAKGEKDDEVKPAEGLQPGDSVPFIYVPQAAPQPVEPKVEAVVPKTEDAPAVPKAEPVAPVVTTPEFVPFTDEDVRQMEAKGKAAFSAGWLVEAHFWMTLARANGVHGLGARLVKMEEDWQAMDCPDETCNVHEGYPAEYAAIAQAYMLLKCGIARHANSDFICDRMMAGSRTARMLALYERLAE